MAAAAETAVAVVSGEDAAVVAVDTVRASGLLILFWVSVPLYAQMWQRFVSYMGWRFGTCRGKPRSDAR